MSQSTQSKLADFPVCSCCGTPKVPVVDDREIWCQIKNQQPFLIPKGQCAQCLRFLNSKHGKRVLAQHLYLALGNCMQVSRVLDTLRHRYLIPILCDHVRKQTNQGTYGQYYLGKEVRIWEPGGGEEDD